MGAINRENNYTCEACGADILSVTCDECDKMICACEPCQSCELDESIIQELDAPECTFEEFF